MRPLHLVITIGQKPTTCFRCGCPGHMIQDCRAMTNATGYALPPRGRGGGVGTSGCSGGDSNYATPARVTTLTLGDAQASLNVVTNMVLIDSHLILMLFDSGATYSFVSKKVANWLDKMPVLVPEDKMVRGPTMKIYSLDTVMRDYVVTIGDFDALADLFMLTLDSLDMILSMDWLAAHHVMVDYFRKSIIFDTPSKDITTNTRLIEIVASLRVTRDMGSSNGVFLASVVDLNKEKLDLSQIPVVSEFPEVFSIKISGVPPEREIEFEISLTTNVQPM